MRAGTCGGALRGRLLTNPRSGSGRRTVDDRPNLHFCRRSTRVSVGSEPGRRQKRPFYLALGSRRAPTRSDPSRCNRRGRGSRRQRRCHRPGRRSCLVRWGAVRPGHRRHPSSARMAKLRAGDSPDLGWRGKAHNGRRVAPHGADGITCARSAPGGHPHRGCNSHCGAGGVGQNEGSHRTPAPPQPDMGVSVRFVNGGCLQPSGARRTGRPHQRPATGTYPNAQQSWPRNRLGRSPV